MQDGQAARACRRADEKASAFCKKALASAALKTAFLDQGATSLWLSPADVASFGRAEEKQLAPIIRASGARVG
jgi:hypothetical protein